VRCDIPNAMLLLVGDGPEEANLGRLVSDRGLSNAVRFAGWQQNPRPFLEAMDVFCLTSSTEGMPLAVLEAWAARLPVVAPRVGGIPEIVEHGRTGMLFEFPRVDQLSHALTSLIIDPALSQCLGDAGYQEVN